MTLVSQDHAQKTYHFLQYNLPLHERYHLMPSFPKDWRYWFALLN